MVALAAKAAKMFLSTGGGGDFGRGKFCGAKFGFQIGAEIFPAKFHARPGPDLCLRLGKYHKGGAGGLGAISNWSTTRHVGNCVNLRKLDPHHTLSSR